MRVFDMFTMTSSKISCSTPGSLSCHLTKIPHSKAEALPLTTTAPKAGVSEPITAQTDLSADNHSFGCFFVALLNLSQIYHKQRIGRIRFLWFYFSGTHLQPLTVLSLQLLLMCNIQNVKKYRFVVASLVKMLWEISWQCKKIKEMWP